MMVSLRGAWWWLQDTATERISRGRIIYTPRETCFHGLGIVTVQGDFSSSAQSHRISRPPSFRYPVLWGHIASWGGHRSIAARDVVSRDTRTLPARSILGRYRISRFPGQGVRHYSPDAIRCFHAGSKARRMEYQNGTVSPWLRATGSEIQIERGVGFFNAEINPRNTHNARPN